MLSLCLNDVALRNVDTIKELTDILTTRNLGDVVDHSSRLRDSIDIIASQNDLILDLLGSVNSDTRKHLDNTDELLTKEVVDLDLGLILADTSVDGEVSVYETHLVFVTLGNTSDHVLDVTSNSTNASNGLTIREPHLKNDVLVLVAIDGHIEVADVTEITSELTTRTLDLDDLAVDLNSDVLRDGDFLNKMENLDHCLLYVVRINTQPQEKNQTKKCKS